MPPMMSKRLLVILNMWTLRRPSRRDCTRRKGTVQPAVEHQSYAVEKSSVQVIKQAYPHHHAPSSVCLAWVSTNPTHLVSALSQGPRLSSSPPSHPPLLLLPTTHPPYLLRCWEGPRAAVLSPRRPGSRRLLLRMRQRVEAGAAGAAAAPQHALACTAKQQRPPTYLVDSALTHSLLSGQRHASRSE